MKPPSFEYAAPNTLEEALAVLANAPDDTKVLAGGQSLVPMLNMRLVRPQTLLDINRVQELSTISETADGKLQLGAMVRQRRLETDAGLRERVPLISEAVRHVAHLQIRMRGTLGGSLAHADPAAELPAVIQALGATLVLKRMDGRLRSVPGEAFFVGAMTTALEPDELLVRVDIAPPPARTGWAFEEVSLTHGAFALVGVAALLHLDPDGRIDLGRLALCGVEGVPYGPAWIEAMLLGNPPSQALFERVGGEIRARVAPTADQHLSPASRRTMAGTLATRALAAAYRRATQTEDLP